MATKRLQFFVQAFIQNGKTFVTSEEVKRQSIYQFTVFRYFPFLETTQLNQVIPFFFCVACIPISKVIAKKCQPIFNWYTLTSDLDRWLRFFPLPYGVSFHFPIVPFVNIFRLNS